MKTSREKVLSSMPKRTFENFEKTLGQLQNFVALPIANDRDRAGIIQAFGFTYEQSWLAIQKTVSAYGARAPTPKQAFSAAMKQGWISTADEALWLKMIDDRNLTSHTYRQALADEVLERIVKSYLGQFESLLSRMRSST